MKYIVTFLLMLLFTQHSYAFTPDIPLANPAHEARAHALFRNFRCMTCQSQAINDSNADLAKDLRQLIRDKIQAGETDQQITDFIVSRYGEYIVFAPPMNGRTGLLWFGPFVLLAIGGVTIWLMGRRKIAD